VEIQPLERHVAPYPYSDLQKVFGAPFDGLAEALSSAVEGSDRELGVLDCFERLSPLSRLVGAHAAELAEALADCRGKRDMVCIVLWRLPIRTCGQVLRQQSRKCRSIGS
jgi:hypothetical protein